MIVLRVGSKDPSRSPPTWQCDLLLFSKALVRRARVTLTSLNPISVLSRWLVGCEMHVWHFRFSGAWSALGHPASRYLPDNLSNHRNHPVAVSPIYRIPLDLESMMDPRQC